MNQIIKSDSHLHSGFSADSDTTMEAMVKRAIALGMPSVCFTDHMDYDFPAIFLNQDMTFLFDMDEYLREIDRLSSVYTQITIYKGVELGLKKNLTDRCNQLISSYPLDFVIGSTHLVDDFDPYFPEYWEDKTEREGILRYYEATLDNIRAGIDYHVYGHIDYIIRYTPTQKELRRQGRQDEEYTQKCLHESLEVIDEILKNILAQGKGIELNTAGLKYGLGHPHPHEMILKRYRELGGEIITVGSDGHEPDYLAFGFDKVPDILKSCGFRYYTIFQNKKPVMLPL